MNRTSSSQKPSSLLLLLSLLLSLLVLLLLLLLLFVCLCVCLFVCVVVVAVVVVGGVMFTLGDEGIGIQFSPWPSKGAPARGRQRPLSVAPATRRRLMPHQCQEVGLAEPSGNRKGATSS